MTSNLHRRHFLAQMICVPIASYVGTKQLRKYVSYDEIDWVSIADDFHTSKKSIMNLNSGSAGNMPIPVLRKYIEYTTEINSAAPYQILQSWNDQIEKNLQRLSEHVGADNGMVYLMRNCTEAMNAILWGIPYKHKCEIIYASCDYNLMENSLLHLQEKKNLKLKKINFGRLKNLTDAEIVKCYEDQITKKTKLIVVTHITHREGQIMPVQSICTMARKYNVEVLVDAAHAIGQVRHSIADMDCDYYISSLHKWLNAPLGSGFLYVADERLPKLAPPISYPQDYRDESVKLQHLGTRAYQNAMAIGDALDYLDTIGIENKQARLSELTAYWTDKLENDNRYEVITDISRSCAIASVKTRKNAAIIKKELLSSYNINVKQSGYKGESFLRISPNIFTIEKNLDKLLEALDAIG